MPPPASQLPHDANISRLEKKIWSGLSCESTMKYVGQGLNSIATYCLYRSLSNEKKNKNAKTKTKTKRKK